MTDDTERLGPVEAACGVGGELVGSADEKVSRGGVAAPLCAHIAELRYLGKDARPCGYTKKRKNIEQWDLFNTGCGVTFYCTKMSKTSGLLDKIAEVLE